MAYQTAPFAMMNAPQLLQAYGNPQVGPTFTITNRPGPSYQSGRITIVMKTDQAAFQQTEAGELIIWENYRHAALWAASLSYRRTHYAYAGVFASYGLDVSMANILVIDENVVDPEALRRVLQWIDSIHPWNSNYQGEFSFMQHLRGDFIFNIQILRVFDFLHLAGQIRRQKNLHAEIYAQISQNPITAAQLAAAWKALEGDLESHSAHHSKLLDAMMKSLLEWAFLQYRLNTLNMDAMRELASQSPKLGKKLQAMWNQKEKEWMESPVNYPDGGAGQKAPGKKKKKEKEKEKEDNERYYKISARGRSSSDGALTFDSGMPSSGFRRGSV